MNFAAITGIPIVAYDHAQLREQATLIGADVTFVSQEELAVGIRSVVGRVNRSRQFDPNVVAQLIQRTEEAMERFAELLTAEVQRCPIRLH